MIDSCVESGDLSPLAPMSVKDLIWVNAAQMLRAKRNNELETAKCKSEFSTMETIYMAIVDLREIARDSNWYAKVGALKESAKAMKKIAPIERKSLPSALLEQQRKKESRRAAMTEAERIAADIKQFMDGGKYIPR